MSVVKTLKIIVLQKREGKGSGLVLHVDVCACPCMCVNVRVILLQETIIPHDNHLSNNIHNVLNQ